jgi:flagellar hook protein FlgE
MSLSDSATEDANNPIAVFDVTFSDAREDGGYLQSVTVAGGGANGENYDATTGLMTVNVAGGPIDINVGRIGEVSLLSQLEAQFAPISVTKDGAAAGTLASVEVDEHGYLSAIYDTGFVQTLFQIPLADVPNVNGLTALDDQAFAISKDSGSLYLWDAGEGPTGAMVGYSREQSNTDLAGELTELIQTQRAYSSNAKIIQTVDEMLQETTNMKR